VFQGGDLVENTFDWFAQDSNGNVWSAASATLPSGRCRVEPTP
jgi:sugar lactone lactonase YvrE